MKVVQTQVWNYAELKKLGKRGEKIIQNALERQLKHGLDSDWSVPDIEAFVGDLTPLGFDGVEVAFSGFCSQGDGASFTGRLALNDLRDYLADDPKPADDDKSVAAEIARIAHKHLKVADLAKVIDYAVEKDAQWGESDFIVMLKRTGHHYSHAYTVSLDCDSWENEFDGADRQTKEHLAAVLKDLDSMRVDLCHHIYKSLEETCEYLMSEEVVIEGLGGDDAYFEADGTCHDADDVIEVPDVSAAAEE